MLGILMLDTAFPRIRGDVGCSETFDFPVRYEVVSGATPEEVVHRRGSTLLPAFVAAGQRLADAGCAGIATTCGFLVRWQRELAEALPIPVLTSALLQLPLVERTLPRRACAGVVTYSAADLPPEALAAAGAHPHTPIEGVDPQGYFAQTIRFGRTDLDAARMRDDTVAAARRLVAARGDVGAIVLECANMPPYREAVQAATGVAVYDAAMLIGWFHAALSGATPRYALRDLW